MKKANPLTAGLERFDMRAVEAPAAKPAVDASAMTKPAGLRSPSREGTVQIAAFFPEDVRTQLKVLAAEQRRDIQDMLAEALNLIFVKYGKPEIARVNKPIR
jgi:hypothetical protein